jgi:hypothetical protein
MENSLHHLADNFQNGTLHTAGDMGDCDKKDRIHPAESGCFGSRRRPTIGAVESAEEYALSRIWSQPRKPRNSKL